MTKLTKNKKLALSKIDLKKSYTVDEAASLVKDITTTKFDASVDIDIRLGVDPRKANQMVRGVVTLPNGTGKETRLSVPPIKRRKQNLPVLITLVWTTISRRSKMVGLMWMLL